MPMTADVASAGKRVAIVQSCYIPWKGYFDLINLVDEFILYDDRQYTRRDWRNRNRIKTPQGTAWLTIPVQVKGKYLQRIDETLVDGQAWREQHWRSLQQCYAACGHFDEFGPRLLRLYEAAAEDRLSMINRAFLDEVCEILGIDTPLTWSTDYAPEGNRSERLLSLCVQSGATTYLSGPSAREYLDETLFTEQGIAIEYMDYAGYPEYEQPYPPFEHAVTILDLLFCTGSAAPAHLKSFAA
jgi:WbqC-like protein family